MGQHRSLQDMIDSVLQGIGEDAVLAKVAAEEEEDEDEEKSNGEGKKMTKAEAERKAEEEESQQGGGTDAATTPSEKTASERVFKLAGAVEEVVAALAGDRQAYSRVVTAQEEPGDQAPGRLSTDEKQQPGPADSGEFGEAKQTIPAQPAMETARPKEPQNHVKTDEKMNVTETAVKEASVDLLGYLRKMANLPDPAEYSGGPVDSSYPGAIARGSAKHLGAASLGAVGAGLLGRRHMMKAMQDPAQLKRMGDFLGKRGPEVLEAYGVPGAALGATALGALAGGTGALATGQSAAGEVQKERAKRDLMARLAAAQQGGVEMAKEGEDAINPANITTAKGDTTLNTGDPTIAKAPGADEQRAHLATNESAEAMTKEDAKAVPKRQLADYLEEPAQTAATDRTLDVALGADRVNEAGAKIASDRKLKIAAARALLQKIASEGCSCNREHLEKGNCQFCKVAARIKQSGCNAKPKMPPKKAQMGAGSAVPPTVQSSDTTVAGGGMGAGGAVPPM